MDCVPYSAHEGPQCIRVCVCVCEWPLSAGLRLAKKIYSAALKISFATASRSLGEMWKECIYIRNNNNNYHISGFMWVRCRNVCKTRTHLAIARIHRIAETVARVFVHLSAAISGRQTIFLLLILLADEKKLYYHIHRVLVCWSVFANLIALSNYWWSWRVYAVPFRWSSHIFSVFDFIFFRFWLVLCVAAAATQTLWTIKWTVYHRRPWRNSTCKYITCAACVCKRNQCIKSELYRLWSA